MKPRCTIHNRPMRWIEGLSVWWCRTYGCSAFSILPAPEKDLFPEHQRRACARPTRKRKPLRYRGRKSESRVTKGGRIIMGRAEYEKLCRELYAAAGGRCAICGRYLAVFSTWLFDHIIKRSAGGPDTRENLRPLCFDCHRREDFGGKQSRMQEQKRAGDTPGACALPVVQSLGQG